MVEKPEEREKPAEIGSFRWFSSAGGGVAECDWQKSFRNSARIMTRIATSCFRVAIRAVLGVYHWLWQCLSIGNTGRASGTSDGIYARFSRLSKREREKDDFSSGRQLTELCHATDTENSACLSR